MTEHLTQEQFYTLFSGILALVALCAIAWALWDNRREGQAEACRLDIDADALQRLQRRAASRGDLPTFSDETRYLIARRRFERMDGVL
ncbi:hypothetical protein [Bradyrhizobium sp. SZCCHNRI2049]|uniref:hypothetical protein n=1 Tax=Bradyrhizobium sp. SZCCHNRI2049 TaxID=3057287 RepID=UPI002916A9A7|nr:hypothetical protein [Bradyrhizobium sp. SZCCHNRI2049]